jgi:hypothetical protein
MIHFGCNLESVNLNRSQIFQEGKLSHFVDGRGTSSNWMAFVNCARYAQEQNLLAIQVHACK